MYDHQGHTQLEEGVGAAPAAPNPPIFSWVFTKALKLY
jgi:hypothetical protein